MKQKFSLSTTHLLMLSFLTSILIGSFLLTLPISSATNQPTQYIDALLTATTSSCVTGLVSVPTYSHWSTFGHIIILLLIQIGGLGVITAITGFTLFFYKKIGMSQGILLQDTLNLNTLDGLSAYLKRVLLGTFVVEGVGALCYMPVFCRDYGVKGIWYSIFNSVSAFCNAGIDIIASDSMCQYATNPMINITTCSLIILGGLGYIVWWDVIDVLRNKAKKRKWQSLTLHSKIVLSSTGFLIVSGALLTLVFEYNNPGTIGNYGLFDKIQMSVFQSVTTRTAGFITIPQENMTNAGALVSIFLMFVGGSPVGTAGGIKTTTFVVLATSALATIKNKNETDLFNRRISKEMVNKAIATIFMFLTIAFIAILLLSAVEQQASFLDITYEIVSATATVGLTRALTPTLSTLGKFIVIIAMYLGRVGPISLAIMFNIKRENKNLIKNPIEEICVG